MYTIIDQERLSSWFLRKQKKCAFQFYRVSQVITKQKSNIFEQIIKKRAFSSYKITRFFLHLIKVLRIFLCWSLSSYNWYPPYLCINILNFWSNLLKVHFSETRFLNPLLIPSHQIYKSDTDSLIEIEKLNWFLLSEQPTWQSYTI